MKKKYEKSLFYLYSTPLRQFVKLPYAESTAISLLWYVSSRFTSIENLCPLQTAQTQSYWMDSV